MIKTLKKYLNKTKNTIISIDKFLFTHNKNNCNSYFESDISNPPKIF